MGVAFQTWEPVYEAILTEFGYDRRGDERARELLAEATVPFESDRLTLPTGATVVVAGAGPSLETAASIERAARGDAVFAASTAADVLEDHGVTVDLLITDLDKNPETVRRLTERGTPVAVHAHGDNLDAIERVVPDCVPGLVLPTTQAAPRAHVCNHGGFTDGDRAAFLADHVGADSLAFVGWDFDDPTVDDEKAAKLVWAERLLYWLECRRDERFAVLDGRRGEIDTSLLPVE